MHMLRRKKEKNCLHETPEETPAAEEETGHVPQGWKEEETTEVPLGGKETDCLHEIPVEMPRQLLRRRQDCRERLDMFLRDGIERRLRRLKLDMFLEDGERRRLWQHMFLWAGWRRLRRLRMDQQRFFMDRKMEKAAWGVYRRRHLGGVGKGSCRVEPREKREKWSQ